MKIVIVLASFLGSLAFASEKTCTVKGMHCEGCAETVQEKLCDGKKYSTCDVKVIDENHELGQIHLITKDSKAAIDEKGLGTILSDAGYTLDKCGPGVGTPTKPAKGSAAKKI